MPDPSDQALAPLLALRDQVTEGWERTLLDISLRALRDGGTDALRALDGLLQPGTNVMPASLSLRDASDLLALLQTKEADRLDRSRDILRRVVAVAEMVAEELLKIALGGKL